LAGVVTAAWGLAAIGAVDRMSALAEAARVLLFFVFLGLTAALSASDDRTRENVAWAAVALIAFQVGLLMTGLISDRIGAKVFEHIGEHALLGAQPRFRGLAEQPMACGSATLLLIGLAAGLPKSVHVVRAAVVGAGLAVVAATLSFATVSLAAAAAFCLPMRRAIRITALVGATTLALAALWLNPLRLELAGRVLIARSPVPSYLDQDRGIRYMPVHEVTVGDLRFEFHFTGYALLAARSISCVLEHPLGVGGRNFVHSCPVMAMNTFGAWTTQRGAHNAYGALLAEGGLLSTLATVALVIQLVWRFRLRRDAPLQGGILVAYLLACAGGASPYQFPFAALLAVASERRSSGEGENNARDK